MAVTRGFTQRATQGTNQRPTLRGTRRTRVGIAAVAGAVAAALLIAPVTPAFAAPQYTSLLAFATSNPTYDPYGSGTTIQGDVSVTNQGWLDFFGRSVVETPDRAGLNPGSSDFSFGARVALTRGVGDWNVLQKGNFADQQWKLSTHAVSGGAKLSCRLSGSTGTVHVFTATPALTTDGSWHDVGCARVGDTVQVKVDGATVAQGSGSIGSISSTKPYLIGSKGLINVGDPDQFAGLLDDAFVAQGETGGSENRAPSARLSTVGCDQLSCSFDASASSDPDGDSLTYAWSFGDGTTANGSTVTHNFAQSGSYTVSVTVRDTAGAASTASTIVTVASDGVTPMAFRGVEGASTTATSISPRVPSTVQPSDALLLFVTANRSDATLQAPSGWQSLGRRTDESMQSQLWVRVAQSGDAGAAIRVSSTASAKMTAHVMAYSGTSPLAPIESAVSAAETRKSAAHTTPVTTASPTSWVVSMWSNMSQNTKSWTTPSAVTARDFRGGTGSGHVTSLVADSAGAAGLSSVGGLTATASQSSSAATMWTVVLRAA